MPTPFRLSGTGIVDLTSLVPKVTAAIQRAAAAQLTVEAEQIIAKSKEIVPLDQGILRASASVGQPEVTPDSVSIRMGYGGAASAYSIVQHENPFFTHAEGRTWKYLERPALDAAEQMGPRLAEAIGGAMEGGVA